ncbi:uncharacterized protein LOC136033052 isoform X2 [Artemia franciscana]|uniref:uncharacterized protein LOC136033052 isoform X2 n=1 Tax=Artemia franciscana TaxID=6661 RepID=UPI0032DB4CDF
MLPSGIVSYVKKVVSSKEKESDVGALARFLKLKETFASTLQNSQNLVQKFGNSAPNQEKIPKSPSYTFLLEECEESKNKGVLGPRVAPGPPDRQKTCRVCVRNLFSSEDSVPYFVCSKCGLKVCDDCASYSSRISHNDLNWHKTSHYAGSMDMKGDSEAMSGSQKSWECSICRRRGPGSPRPNDRQSSMENRRKSRNIEYDRGSNARLADIVLQAIGNIEDDRNKNEEGDFEQRQAFYGDDDPPLRTFKKGFTKANLCVGSGEEKPFSRTKSTNYSKKISKEDTEGHLSLFAPSSRYTSRSVGDLTKERLTEKTNYQSSIINKHLSKTLSDERPGFLEKESSVYSRSYNSSRAKRRSKLQRQQSREGLPTVVKIHSPQNSRDNRKATIQTYHDETQQLVLQHTKTSASQRSRSNDSTDTSDAETRSDSLTLLSSSRDVEGSRSSFRRRSCFRAAWKKQTLMDGEEAGYEADIQSGSNLDSTPSPASPDVPPSPVFPYVAAVVSRSRSSAFLGQCGEEKARKSRKGPPLSNKRESFTPPVSPRGSRDSSLSYGSSCGKDPGRQDSAVSNDGEGIRIIIDDVDSSRNREVSDFGLQVSFQQHDDYDIAIVEKVYSSSSAATAGLKIGYRIIRWDGVPLQMRTSDEIQAILEDSGDVVEVEYKIMDEEQFLRRHRRESFRGKEQFPIPASLSRRRLPRAPRSETPESLPDILIDVRQNSWESGINLIGSGKTFNSQDIEIRIDGAATLTRSSSIEQVLLKPWMDSFYHGGSSAPASLMPSRRGSRAYAELGPPSSLPVSRRSSFVGEVEEVFINTQQDFLPAPRPRTRSFRTTENQNKLQQGGHLTRTRSLRE